MGNVHYMFDSSISTKQETWSCYAQHCAAQLLVPIHKPEKKEEAQTARGAW